MTMLVSDIGAGLLLGLLGSLHCIGMCGGIAGALQLTAPGKYPPLANTLLFNAGRIAGYAAMAAIVAAMLSAGLSGMPALPQALRAIAGIMLILMGLFVAGWLATGKWNPLLRLEALGSHLWQYIMPVQKKLMHNPGLLARIGVGFCWGWLPCGLVYSTLAWAVASHDPLASAMRMGSFGLGTLPALIATGAFAAQIQRQLQKRRWRQAAGVMLMLFGLWTLAWPYTHRLSGVHGSMQHAPHPDANPVTHDQPHH